MRALPAAVTLTDQARARKHDTGLGNRLADQASGLLGRDAVLTVTGPRNTGKLPDCRTPAREQVTGLAETRDAGIGTVILIRDHEYVCEDRGARRVREDPAAPVNLAGEMRTMGLMEPGDCPMALTITNHLTRSADTAHSAGFGDGAGIVIRLPGRVLLRGRAAAIETAGAASQIPADCNPQVHGEGFWSRVNAWAGQFGLTGHAGIVQASRGARGRVMAGPRLAMAYSRLVV